MIKHKTKIMVMILEILFAVILISWMISPAIKLHLAADGLDVFDEINLYGVVNQTSPEVMFDTFDEAAVQDFFINEYYDEDTQYIIYRYLANIVDNVRIERRIANKTFFSCFPVSVISGRPFSDEDFKVTSDPIPILVGCNLADIYKLNNIYEFTSGENDSKFQTIVIGILEKDTNYPRMATISESLDNAYVIPMSEWFVENYFGFSDYDMAISNTVMYAEDYKKLQSIEVSAKDQHLFDFEFVSFKDEFTKQNMEIRQAIQMRIIITLCISLVFLCLLFLQIKCWCKK